MNKISLIIKNNPIQENFNIFVLTVYSLAIITSIIGIILMYSAAGGSFSPWANKQLIRLVLSIVSMAIVSKIKPRIIMDYAFIIYWIVVFLLLFVLIKGKIGMGAQRWLNVFTVSLQPSEFIKIATPITLAAYYQKLNFNQSNILTALIKPFLLIIIPMVLVLFQPDLGTAIIILLTGATALFIAGINQLWFIAGITSCLAMIPVIWKFLHTYQKQRILIFFDPYLDATGSGYQIIQSKIALFSGGFLGKGFLKGSQSQLGFLPEKHTDFIFAFLCEEHGILAGIFIIILFSLLLICCFIIVINAKNIFIKISTTSLMFLLFSQFFINILMVAGLLPVVGVPLPFISYGGSAMLSYFIALGCLISFHTNANQKLYNPPGAGFRH